MIRNINIIIILGIVLLVSSSIAGIIMNSQIQDLQDKKNKPMAQIADATHTSVDVLNIADEGATVFRNRTNSTTAFQIQNAAGTTILNTDSTNQRVGIGTTSPGYRLDVQGGDINTSGVYRKGGTAGTSITCTGGQFLQNPVVSGGIITAGTCAAAGGIGGSGTANYLSKFTGANTIGNSQIFDNGTNVGIGTTSPSTKLDVNGVITGRDNATFGYMAGSSGGIYLTKTSQYGKPAVQAITSGFIPDNLLLNPAGGNVGIGTTSPSTKLNLYDASSGPIISLQGSDSNYRGLKMADIANSEKWFVGNNNNNNFVIRNNNSTDYLTVLNNSGNVGIGTTSPSAQLHLADIYSAGGKNLLIGDDSYLTDIDIANTLGIYGNYDSTQAHIKLGSNGPTISGYNGNVGIGTTSPSYKLDIQNCSPGQTCLNVNGKISASEVDPIYEIEGVKYATYGLSTVGLKEETVGKIKLESETKNKELGIYSYIIDFDKQEKGSDLWLFKQITAFGKNWQDLVVNLTPEGRAETWYELLPKENKLAIYGTAPINVSYRLIAPRFDWPNRATNLASDQNLSGLKVR